MMNSKRGIDRYSTFGLRDEWLPSIFLWEEKWTERNNLGPIQVNAVESWLEDAGLIVGKRVTPSSGESVISTSWNLNQPGR